MDAPFRGRAILAKVSDGELKYISKHYSSMFCFFISEGFPWKILFDLMLSVFIREQTEYLMFVGTIRFLEEWELDVFYVHFREIKFWGHVGESFE